MEVAFVATFLGNIGKYGVWYLVGIIVVYPAVRKKIPKSFVRDFFDCLYLSLEKLYWKVKLFLVNYNKNYLTELNKLIKVSTCSHIQGLNFHEFTPNSKHFISRYYKPYVNTDKRKENFIEKPAANFGDEQGFSNSISNNNNLSPDVNYVLGPAGYGKTSLAKRICIDIIRQSSPTPIFLSCSNKLVQRGINEIALDDDNDDESKGLLSNACELSVLVSNFWRSWKTNVLPQFFQKQLNNGCTVIIDGFDDIPNLHDRKFFSEWLEKQNRIYVNSHFIVFSRKYAFKELKAKNSRGFMLEGFNMSQIESFTVGFYKAAVSNNRPCYKKTTSSDFKTEFVLRVGNDPILIRMASNPLLLTFMLDLHYTGNKLPENKTKLCEKILKNSLSWKRSSITESQIIAIINLLSEISFFSYFKPKNRELDTNYINSLVEPTGFESLNELSEHLLSNSAIVEKIDWNSGNIRFVHKSFLEYCVAWNCCKNKDYGTVSINCGDEVFREILQFFVHQSKNLTPLFELIEKHVEDGEKNTKSSDDLIKAKFYILTIINDNFESKLSAEVHKRLADEQKVGFSKNIRLYVGVDIHLRLTKLLYSDPIDQKPIGFKEAAFLNLEYKQGTDVTEQHLIGLEQVTISELIIKINDFYGITRGTFNLPTRNMLPDGFDGEALVRNSNRYELYQSDSDKYKLIQKSIEESIIEDFSIAYNAISHYRNLDVKKIKEFAGDLIFLWSPSYLFSKEDNKLKFYDDNLFKKYLNIFDVAPGSIGKQRTDSSVIDAAFIKSGVSSNSPIITPLRNMYLYSLDKYSGNACNNFMMECYSYLHIKTLDMVNDGVVCGWGKIYISYISPFYSEYSESWSPPNMDAEA